MHRPVGSAMLAAALTVATTIQAEEDAGRYRLLATTRTATMQQEINEVAAQGYRVIAASRSEGTEVVVVLERATGSYDYRLLATSRTTTLEKELNQAAADGYRAVARAIDTKRGIGQGFSGEADEGELIVIAEKGPDGATGLSYRVLSTTRTATMQKELSQAVEGFRLLALVSRGEHVAVLERAE